MKIEQKAIAAWAIAAVPISLFLFVPLFTLAAKSSASEVWASLVRSDSISAIRLSLITSLASVALMIIAGMPLAYLLGRYRFVGKRVVSALTDLPIVMPPAVAGIALLTAFGTRGVLPTGLPFTTAAVIAAQVFVASPLFIRSAAVGFAALDNEVRDAAELDGVGAWSAFRYVALPIAMPAILGGALLGWARALGEFGATIIFAGNFLGRTQTMPLAIYLGFELDYAASLSLSAVLLLLSLALLILARWVLGFLGRLQ